MIFIANVATAIATPFAGLFMTLMIFRDDINEGYDKPRFLQFSMLISYLFVLVITGFAVAKMF